MTYVKDTDFLPDVKNVSQDAYRLTYGIAKIRNERRIYDIIVYLCRAYPDTPLRRAKITAWKSVLEEVAEKIGTFSSSNGDVVYIPYFELVCTPEGLYNLYRFAIDVLNELYSLDKIPNYREVNGANKEGIQLFFPIDKLPDLMHNFARKCRNNNAYGEEIEDIVENELVKRGLVSGSTKKTQKTYEETFFNDDKTIVPSGNGYLETAEDNSPSWYTSIGFIYLALREYFTMAYDRKKTRDYTLGTVLDVATYRIAQGLFKYNEPINGEKRTTSKQSFYSMVRSFKGEAENSEARKDAEKRFKDFIKDR